MFRSQLLLKIIEFIYREEYVFLNTFQCIYYPMLLPGISTGY